MSWLRSAARIATPVVGPMWEAGAQLTKANRSTGQPTNSGPSLGPAAAAPQAKAYGGSNVLQRTGPNAYDAVQKSLLRRVQGKPAPGLADKFAQMDNATATGAAQARQDAMRPGMFGHGMASRGAQRVQQDNMARISDDKLAQAAMLGSDTQNAEQAITANRNADREFSYRAASDLGDVVTQAGIAKQGLTDQGLSYTGYGEGALANQANQQAASAARAQDTQDRLLTMQERQLERSLQGGADSKSGKWWQNMGQWASIFAG